MKKSKSLIFTTLLAFAMVFTMMFATMPNNVKSVYASSTQKSVGFAIKEHFDVYFAETGNNKVQNTSTGVDGNASITSCPLSFFNVLTLPNEVPTTTGSPILKVPF